MILEARDRLTKPVDIATVYGRQRSTGSVVFQDVGRDPFALSPPPRQGYTATTPGGLRIPRAAANMRGRNLYGRLVVRRENTPKGSAKRARGRSTNSALPSWYPRTPLRDITAIMKAIDRRRAQQREIEDQETQSLTPEGNRLLHSSLTGSSDQLDHSSSVMSQIPTFGGKKSNILLRFANQTAEHSECLTPEKKLLSSIDTVEKVVKQELQKLRRTPTAKKAEREKRVRTLMSMR